ncbi:DNA-dependent protein kinase catalytic subunit-like [Antedon mediterranea]|uniref:DNA-dependent protein kinase catalytic subunit-like n=1 Tax=Antedon mediterranea TaxID=105859 RepID=UPI003AF62F4F
MGQEINEILVSLHGFLKSPSSSHSGEHACLLAADLSTTCLSQASEIKIAYYSSVLFNEEKGILCFLKTAIQYDEFLDCKIELLDFLVKFIEKIKNKIEPYAVAIKDVSFAITCRDPKAKVKVKAFVVLIKLLEVVGKTKSGPDLKAELMIKRFFGDLMNPTKLPQTVKQHLYVILGIFAEFYPELMISLSEKLLQVYLKTLKDQMTSKNKKPETTTIAGCLVGLTHYLTSFTQSCEEESEHTAVIYRYASMAIDPTVTLVRYNIPKAGLQLFTKHAPQFNDYLYRDHMVIYQKIYDWTKHKNRDMSKAGYRCLDSFLKVLADMLVEKAKKSDSEGRAIFKWFIQQFRSIIDNPSSDSMDLATAVRGYGFFAAPCKLFLSKEDVQFMFSEMIQRSEQIYLQQDVSEEKVSHLPNFLEALASIIEQLDQLSDSFLLSLENLCSVMINNYPQVPTFQQFLCTNAILNVFITLAPKGSTLKDLLSVVVYQGILKTISHKVQFDMGQDQDVMELTAEDIEDIKRDARTITYKNYMQLWLKLLDSPFMKEVDAFGTNYQERCEIHKMIYNELLTSVLKILQKLDLTATKKQTTEDELLDELAPSGDISSDPINGLQPSNYKDFQIFINLVEFCRDILSETKGALFEQWLLKFSQEIIIMSTQKPLISGFYKLLAVCMTCAQRISYFEDCNDGNEDSMDIAYTQKQEVSQNERKICFTLFTKFSLEVLTRLKLFKHDLLLACLNYVLSLPYKIVEDILEQLIPVMKITFNLGLGYLKIAETGLSALKTWTSNIPQHKLRPLYNEVLPIFDDYLRASSIKAQVKAEQISSKSGYRRHGASLIKIKETSSQTEETPLKKIQLGILDFLGSLGGQVNSCMLNTNSEDIARIAVAWDREPRLPFPVPFVDIKPTVNLDLFLPRIVELALSSGGNRQTKVAACESLHTIVLYMLGRGNQQTGEAQAKSPMQNLYKRVFPALLQLACDVEEVAKQLFEPFVMQLIHWFTNNRKFESEETMSLLDAILDGIVHPTDTALRDYSAKCVKEFLKWSIKQTTKAQQEKSPINAKSLLKRLYSMALHPNVFKRLGAALAFNSIYTVFREEDSLVDMFTFETVVVYIRSLALAHYDDKSVGTQEQASEVLKHLGRIMKEKASIFNKQSKHRRVPRGFPLDLSPTLSHMVLFLLSECGRPQTECRHQCMTLVSLLTPLQPGGNTTSDWMRNTLKEKGPDYFTSRFEGGGGTGVSVGGIRKHPTLASMSNKFTLKASTRWFDHLLAALDCYCWSFGESLITPNDVFTGKNGKSLFASLEFFLHKLAMSDITAATRMFRINSSDTFTPQENEEYDYAKCTLTVRVFDFLTVVLMRSSDIQKVLPPKILNEDLIGLIVSCILEPCSVGFNMADIMVSNNLPKRTCSLLKLLMDKVPSLRNKIESFIKEKLVKNKNLNIFSRLNSLFTDPESDYTTLGHLISGYEQLHKVGLLVPVVTKICQRGQSPINLANQVLDCVFKSLFVTQDGCVVTSKPTPMALDLRQQLLKLAFAIGVKTKFLVSFLRIKDQVSSSSNPSKGGTITKGAVFFTTFKTAINCEFMMDVNEVIKLLMHELDDDPQQTCSIMGSILQYIINDKQLRKKYGTSIVNSVLSNWNKLRPWWIAGSTREMKSACLLLLKSLLQIDSKFASDCKHPSFSCIFKMFQQLLCDKKSPLTFKAQLLEVLYFFTQVPEPHLTELKESLDEFVTYNFPLSSTEFNVGTTKHNDYITALNKLLTALVFSGSMMLLQVIIIVVCREEKHVHENCIQETFAAFIKRLQPEEQEKSFNVAFEIFLKESSPPKELRRSTIERVCIPMLRLSSSTAVKKFFTSHIKKILGIIEAKQTKYPESTFETQLVSKICCFQLVEIMYSRLTKEELRSPSSEINKAFCGLDNTKGEELTRTISKISRTVMVEDVRGESVAKELRRQLHCMAYNTMMAVVCCTQTDLKFYNAFLFNDNAAKGQLLFENIIDSRREYKFEIEYDSQPERKKRYIAIRNQARASTSSGQEGESIHYLSSQYLADSSLSEDIQRFDFTSSRQFTPSIDSMSQADDSRESTNKEASSSETPASAMVYGDSVVMEDDALNQHECMASLVGLLNHMKANIMVQTAQGSQSSNMPGWMSWLNQKARTSGDLGIKLFISRLIVNIPEIFEPYAQHWFSPLMSLIIEGSGSDGIHSLVVDIMVVMLQWTPVAIPQERAIANRLVEFLMFYSYHETRPVLRRNLDLIKTTIECWKPVLNISTSVVMSSFSIGDCNDLKRSVGIQLLGVVLANNLPPISPSSHVDEEVFYSKLTSNLSCKYKQVHAPTAEVIGMIMKRMKDEDRLVDGMIHRNTEKELTALHSTRKEIFITCMDKICLHFPYFADRFMHKILFDLPSLHGQPKVQCVDILVSRVEAIENVYIMMKNIGIVDLLSHRDEAQQVSALKLVNGTLKVLKAKEVHSLLPSIVNFVSNSSAACREVMFDILMWIFDNYRDETVLAEEGAKDVLEMARVALLQGLTDEEPALRLVVRNFWSHETRLPASTVDRMVAILQCMYCPITETDFLSYATNLLLEMTSRSPDYKREIFETPLSECRFEAIIISHSWRQRHQAISTPLFVETQSSQSSSGSGSPPSYQDQVGGNIRATQDAQQFMATQEIDATGNRKNAYNWLTGSQDTFSEFATGSSLSSSSSSLLFTLSEPSKKRKFGRKDYNKPVGPGFGKVKPKATDAPDAGDAASARNKEILRLKRRFLKDKSQQHVHFARKESKKKQKISHETKQEHEKHLNAVTMYRQYRKGDLPDIQIKNSYVIAPLQALAQHDATLAQMLFTALFCGIFTQIEEVKREVEAATVVSDLNQHLNNMISSSTKYFPPFIHSIQEITFHHSKQLNLDPSAVSTASLMSQEINMGIVLLEEKLMKKCWSEESRRKKPRLDKDQLSPEISTWIELSRLYKAVGEFDVLQGIFTSRIGTKDITKKAVETEARGDYATACKLYNEALTCDDWARPEPQQIEQDFWDEARLNCCNQLSQWKELEKYSVENIDEQRPPDLTRIWSDQYYKDCYMPYIVRSKLKLLLAGGEDESLLQFIDLSMKDQDKRDFLESSFSEELGLLYILQEDYNRAKYYINEYLQLFLQNWCGLGQLMSTSRMKELRSVQRVTEVKEFLHVITSSKPNGSDNAAIFSLLDKWNSRYPDPTQDPIDIWDDVTTNRSFFMDKFTTRGRSDDTEDSEMISQDTNLCERIELGNLTMQLKMADSACQMANFSVAKKSLKKSYCILENHGSLLPEWTFAYVNMHQTQAPLLDASSRVTTVLATFNPLDKLSSLPVLQEEMPINIRFNLKLSSSYEIIAHTLLESGETVFQEIDESKLRKLKELITIQSDDPNEIAEDLFNNAYNHLKKAVECAFQATSGEVGPITSQAHMAMASYCDKLLRYQEEDTMLNLQNFGAFPLAIVTNTLQAMKDGSSEAIQRFPRLLQLVESHPDTAKEFIEKASSVPCWMFISWISQMVALLDKDSGHTVHGIVTDIATNYPQALCYPFKISSDNFKFDKSTNTGVKNAEAVERIQDELAKVPMIESFINALNQLSNPDHLFKDWTKEIVQLFKAPVLDKSAILKSFKQMYTALFDYSSSRGNADPGAAVFGNFRRKFAQDFQKKVIAEFGKDGSKLAKKTVSASCRKIQAEIERTKRSIPSNIKEYSTWFLDFHTINPNQELEIPGQYDGKTKPLLSHHVTIAGFSEQVKVMSSLRKPKRIIIRGNDEKDHMFLAKGGEDLRLDQRIEQLFTLMNEILEKDATCCQRGLKLKTYQVIPMTPRLGLIEWLQKTCVFREFLYGAMTESQLKCYNSANGSRAKIFAWVKKFGGGQQLNQQYEKMYSKANRTETLTCFRDCESQVPPDLLRQAFFSMSSTPEAFLTLRTHFIRTHSVLCICQYLLGIGDRHLSNFLVDMETGGMIGIDFGHAFGSATQFLPVPELLPFRLTRQIMNLMLPFNQDGLLQSTMCHTLRAIRNNHDLLLNTMDVFIKEPSLDWKEFAQKAVTQRTDEDEVDGGDMSWYPKEKVSYAKAKFKGANPAYITRQELHLGHGTKPVCVSFKSVAKGDPKYNQRAQEPDHDLSVETQVACLIDQATDANAMARIYYGWEPWM